MPTGIYIGNTMGGSSKAKWTPQSLIVQDAAPTHVVITFDKALTNDVYTDYTSSIGNVLSVIRDGTNTVHTVVLDTAYVYGSTGTITYKGKVYSVTNNVAWTAQIPTSLGAVVISATRIDLSWTNVDTTGDGVRIESSNDNINFTEVTTVALGVAAYSATVTEGLIYYFRIRAYKGALNSAYTTYVRAISLSAEYATVLAAMTNKPSYADMVIQNDWMKGIVDNGYFAKAELLDIFSTHTNAAGEAYINWKNPGTFNPSPVNAPPFEAYAGITGVVSGSKCIRLNFTPSINGTLIGQNNICLIIGVSGSGGQDSWDIGGYDGTNAILSKIKGSTNFGNAYFNGGTVGAFASTDEIGHVALSRGSNLTYGIFKNKNKTVITDTSTGLLASELYAAGINLGTIIGPRQIRYVLLFSYLNDNEVQSVIALTERYLRHYSKGLNITARFADSFIEAIPISENTTLVSDDGNQIDLWGNASTGGVENIHYTYSLDGLNFAVAQPTDIPTGYRRSHILKDGSNYYLYASYNDVSIHLFTSTDKIHFADQGEVLTIGAGGTWDASHVANSFVWKEGATVYMLYDANTIVGGGWLIGLATASAYAGPFTKYGSNPVLTDTGVSGAWMPEMPRVNNAIIKNGGNYYLYYSHLSTGQIKRAYSTDLHTWTLEGALSDILVFHSWAVDNGDECLVEFKGKSYLFWSPTDQISQSHTDVGIDNRTFAQMLALTP